ncbi:MAG TPA: hypothetical protein PLL06_13590, partial [Acidobacteriota bacterium]|nr:hypothetical protein [Acidobacteriota bacterium]
RMLDIYKQQTGTCPTSWKQILPVLQQHLHEATDNQNPPRSIEFSINQKAEILDTGTEPLPYVINVERCRVELSKESKIPSRWDPAGY